MFSNTYVTMFNNIFRKHKNILGITGVTGWGILGFYRGTQHYQYNYNCDMKKYNRQMIRYNSDIEKYKSDLLKYPSIDYWKPEPIDKPSKYYITNILYGFYGTGLYLFPYSAGFMVIKEIYRIENYLRNIEVDDNKYYHTLELF